VQPRIIASRTLLVLAIGLLAAGCASGPKKYRKKRGCDCPKWNQAPARPAGDHAWHWREGGGLLG